MAKKKNAQPVSKNQVNADRVKAPVKHEPIPIEAGDYPIPGGTITVTPRGVSTYQGSTYLSVKLKRKYLDHPSDRDEQGKVKVRMGKK